MSHLMQDAQLTKTHYINPANKMQQNVNNAIKKVTKRRVCAARVQGKPWHGEIVNASVEIDRLWNVK